MRSIWKGSISFGLVNIPVGLYPATVSASEIKLRMLRAKDLSPIRYKRIAEADDKEVPWEEIVKGYEFQKDAYVVVTKEDLEKVNVKSNQTVDIKEFVQLKEIDPMFFDEPYYLAPLKGGEKAYTILHEALVESGKVGIAKVVIKTREHLAAVKPKDGVLMLILGPDLRIRRFTAIAEKTFNLIPTDVGRPVTDIVSKIEVQNLPELVTEVIDSLTTREVETRDKEGRWWSVRIRPYKTTDNRIDGVVIALVDIDALKAGAETRKKDGD